MKRAIILNVFVLMSIVASAQSNELLLQVQPKILVDNTQLIVEASNSKTAILHWNNRTFKMVGQEDNLNSNTQSSNTQYSVLHWNNKVIKLNKEDYLSAPHREFGKFEDQKNSPKCHSTSHKKKHI